MDESRDHHKSDQDTQDHIKQTPDIDLVDLIARPEAFRHEKPCHHHDRRKLDATDQVQFIGSKEVLEKETSFILLFLFFPVPFSRLPYIFALDNVLNFPNIRPKYKF